MLSIYALPPALLSLASTTLAQSTFQSDMSQDSSRASVSASLMNITFSTTTTANCAQNATGTDALSIAIRTVPEKETCFDLDSTFTNQNESYSTRGYSCSTGQTCGVNYTVMAWEYNSMANYSQVFYTQTRNPFTFSSAADNNDDSHQDEVGGRLTLHTFNGANCKKVKGEAGHKQQSIEWNCNTLDGACSTVPFAIKSFSIGMTDPDDVNDRNCTISKTAGANGRSTESSVFAALAVAFAGVAFLV